MIAVGREVVWEMLWYAIRDVWFVGLAPEFEVELSACER